MKVYSVKPEADCASDVVIYWSYDIGGFSAPSSISSFRLFLDPYLMSHISGGFTQGRTKAMCDTFAQLNKCEVILADVYLGDETTWQDPLVSNLGCDELIMLP